MYGECMLNEGDKKWIVEAVKSIVTTQLDEKLGELARMVARGFNDCARKEQLEDVERRLTSKIDALDSRLCHVEDVMVTRDYLDERLDVVKEKQRIVHKQQSYKTMRLVQVLEKKRVLGRKQANTILALEPYPQKLEEAS